MNYVEFTGKTVDDAVEKGLKELGVSKENVDIRVLDEGKKRLFGSVKARVEIAVVNEETAKNDDKCECKCDENKTVDCVCDKTDGQRTVEFLEGLFDLLNITACTELVGEDEKVEINVTTANTTAIIGKHGAMLDAIQTLAGAVANTGREDYKRVVVDCENYRENREVTLNKLAENLAQKAIRLGKKIKLEPMNPYERRIIHSALSARGGVKTESEGKEPNRYIVVIPDNLEDPNAEAIQARNNQRRNDRSRGNKGYGNRSGGRNGFGNKGGGFKKYNNRERSNGGSGATGGTTMKPSNDFFGIFLGNSGNTDKNE